MAPVTYAPHFAVPREESRGGEAHVAHHQLQNGDAAVEAEATE